MGFKALTCCLRALPASDFRWELIHYIYSYVHYSWQGASTKLSDFTPDILREIQDQILSLEAEDSAGKRCTACPPQSLSVKEDGNDQKADFRCLECFDHMPRCSHCILQEHRQHPFHRIQRWTGEFFEKYALFDLGQIVYLGHNGEKCPRANSEPQTFVVVHTNGVHYSRILYCDCKAFLCPQDRALQLIRSQLFPPTINVPQTVFSFHVLDDFHRHSLSAKVSAYDYFDALRKHTDAAFPQCVPVRRCFLYDVLT